MATIFPGNVSMILSALVPVVMFEILSDDFPLIFFRFDEKEQTRLQKTMNDQMIDLGYETHNSILNLNSMFILLIFILLKCLFVGALKIWVTKMKSGKKMYNEMYKDLFWGSFISIFLEGFLEFLICAGLNAN